MPSRCPDPAPEDAEPAPIPGCLVILLLWALLWAGVLFLARLALTGSDWAD